jgi:hypothetical protein
MISSISITLDDIGILASTTSYTTSIKGNFSFISLLVFAIWPGYHEMGTFEKLF